MKSIDLNANWKVRSGEDENTCDLPYDALIGAARDLSCAFGELSGYFPAARAVFTKSLPQVRHGRALLVISGACGVGDVALNGDIIGRIADGGPTAFELTDKLTGAHNTLTLDLVSDPAMSDKYVGLGVADGVKLYTFDTLDFEYGSLFVSTSVADGKTYADVSVTLVNDGAASKLTLECTAFNARGKRAGKKQRKIFMRAGATKTFSVRVRIAKPYEWSPSDPYTYSLTAKIVTEHGAETSVSAGFGIVTRALSSTRGLYINGKNTLLMGAYVSHADAALGCASNYSNEVRRLTALKALGYNAVHFVCCPSSAALDACDDVGMFAFVDIFGALREGKAPLDPHIFASAFAPELAVKVLRNHPSVTIYGVADNVPECYGRHGGHALIADIAGAIKATDATRPVTVSVSELVPTAKESDDAGIKTRHFDSDKAAIAAAREKDVFGELTAGAFAAVDVCGFNYLYPLYETEKLKRDRLIIGARTENARAFESLDATEKNGRVFGDFNECGIDYPGGGKLNEQLCTLGDIDAICDEKPQAAYKRILLGERGVAYIAVCDPDTDEPTHMWNWPRYLGKPVTVKVYTSGDVVALYLDNRLIGRKLAGKLNKHIATFTVDYYPGTLTAIAYFRGVECARTQLKSASSPKLIRLSAFEKGLSVSRGDLGFVHVDVCDRDGELVPYAMRELTATVTGGTLVAFINADPMLRKNSFDSCPAYGGRALAVVKPDEDAVKTVVKLTGDGLLSSKLSFKVKN